MTDSDLDLANRLADAARQAIAPYFRTRVPIENKLADGYDPVTDADRAAEAEMRSLLETERPDDAIVGEEYGARPGRSGRTWWLDPIDGTRAFIAGLASWTVLIGLVEEETATLGVIDQPTLGERYIGTPDGANLIHRDGRRAPLRVSSRTKLTDAILSTTDPFILSPAEQGAFTHLRHTARLTRYGLDAYAYARLAAGDIDIVAEAGLSGYDVAALIPVVRGAGGLACTWRGEPARLGGQLVCAASQEILDQALISLRRSAD